jgi:hypothetical protein
MWLSLNHSTAPNLEGLRMGSATLPGVDSGTLPREGEEAMEEVVPAGS